MDICYGSRIGQMSAIGVTFAVFQRVQFFLSIRMGIWFMALLTMQTSMIFVYPLSLPLLFLPPVKAYPHILYPLRRSHAAA